MSDCSTAIIIRTRDGGHDSNGPKNEIGHQTTPWDTLPPPLPLLHCTALFRFFSFFRSLVRSFPLTPMWATVRCHSQKGRVGNKKTNQMTDFTMTPACLLACLLAVSSSSLSILYTYLLTSTNHSRTLQTSTRRTSALLLRHHHSCCCFCCGYFRAVCGLIFQFSFPPSCYFSFTPLCAWICLPPYRKDKSELRMARAAQL